MAVLEFSDPATDATERLRVVYKPKDMGVDAAYQPCWQTSIPSDLAPLRCLTVHLSDGYGYMEFVSHQLCADEHELGGFMQCWAFDSCSAPAWLHRLPLRKPDCLC